ncbi:MAG TPA: TrmH family RNA methyltransferase [Roseiflexaceae bacterium]|nr:TrmH family RNA methyltransferase [Roseiflexaceae bacterium]
MNPRHIRIHTENADFQQLEALRRNREKRRRMGAFLAEGVRPINQLLAAGWPLQALLYADGRPLSDWARKILQTAPAATHFSIDSNLFARLSGKSEPSELIALAGIPPDDLGRIAPRPDLLVVVFDRPASPGNLGTLIRSCDGLGVHGLVLAGHSVDLYDPETVSATTGSLFAVPTVRLDSSRALEPWLEQLRDTLGSLQVVGTDEAGTARIDQHDWRQPTVLVVGNETWGMSAHFHELCNTIVRIPIGGTVSSLNVACASSIVLYEIARQRAFQAMQPAESEPQSA